MADNNLSSNADSKEITIYGDTIWLEDIKAKLESGAITEEQWKQVQWFFQENKFAPVQPSIICKSQECPYWTSCHPPGTLIRTANRGNIPIEQLDTENDRVISYIMNRKSGGRARFRAKGRRFTLHTREYAGSLVIIKAAGEEQRCTHDHISLMQWNDKGLDAFLVYLMKKGDLYRVGKTTVTKKVPGGRLSGLSARANAEKADAMWILGIYQTNSEALLAEEKFSILFGAPKALFIATPVSHLSNNKEGLYRWVTQEQIDTHHLSFLKPNIHYMNILKLQGLDWSYPIWERGPKKDRNKVGSASKTLEVRSCNLVANVMDVPVVSSIIKAASTRPTWWPVTIEREDYQGIVYSLEVEGEHTYIANDIITHNCPLARANLPAPTNSPCPVEETTKQLWFQQLSKEVGVAEDGFEAMDLGAACDIINLLIQKQRIQWEMVKNPEVSVRTIVGMSPDGEPIVDMKANPTYFTLKALNQIQLKIMEGLLTTREARSKDQSRKTQDSAVRYSQIEAVAQRLKQLTGRNADGSPMNVIDIVANLPEVKTSDELMNVDPDDDNKEEEEEKESD